VAFDTAVHDVAGAARVLFESLHVPHHHHRHSTSAGADQHA
jgi:hypothetical protein